MHAARDDDEQCHWCGRSVAPIDPVASEGAGEPVCEYCAHASNRDSDDGGAELSALEAEFEAAGGRGVDLAERIDQLRAERPFHGTPECQTFGCHRTDTADAVVRSDGAVQWRCPEHTPRADEVGATLGETNSAVKRRLAHLPAVTIGWVPECRGDREMREAEAVALAFYREHPDALPR